MKYICTYFIRKNNQITFKTVYYCYIHTIFFVFFPFMSRTVFIWRAGGDGRYETTISIPNMPFPNSCHKGKLGTTTGTWIAVCWVEPKVLLTSSLWGELLSWDLSTSKNNPNLFHTYHSRGLFCIAPVPKNDKISDNWRTKSE